MTTREKVAHILRRFGLGASKSELDFYEKLGVDGTLDRLINYDSVDENYPVNVWEFAQRLPERPPRLRAEQVASWWALRMMVSQRPLQEKLTLFWHDHFAVSGSKVDEGPNLSNYLDVLRTGAAGSFKDLLINVSQTPAMIEWLDNNTNVKGKPNENFAREVMELFTLGIGHYTETDIQEAARAFTGWTFRRNLPLKRPALNFDPTKALDSQIMENKPLTVFDFRQNLHDTGTKKVLGSEADFDGIDVLEILVSKPETAINITSKLWEWFAYPKPEPKIQERLAKVYRDSGYQIRPILFAIAKSDEFWSDKCVRKQIKSPVDFTISVCRSLGIGASVIASRPSDASPLKSLPLQVIQAPRVITQALTNQGMGLLFPPDVAGWDWGTAWISSATMVERIKLSDALFTALRRLDCAGPLASAILATNPKTGKDAIKAMLAIFDIELPQARQDTLVQTFDKNGGMNALLGRNSAPLFQSICRVLFAAPEYQFC